MFSNRRRIHHSLPRRTAPCSAPDSSTASWPPSSLPPRPSLPSRPPPPNPVRSATRSSSTTARSSSRSPRPASAPAPSTCTAAPAATGARRRCCARQGPSAPTASAPCWPARGAPSSSASAADRFTSSSVTTRESGRRRARSTTRRSRVWLLHAATTATAAPTSASAWPQAATGSWSASSAQLLEAAEGCRRERPHRAARSTPTSAPVVAAGFVRRRCSPPTVRAATASARPSRSRSTGR